MDDHTPACSGKSTSCRASHATCVPSCLPTSTSTQVSTTDNAECTTQCLADAIKELVRPPVQPVSVDNLHMLRIGTMVLTREPTTGDSNKGKLSTLDALWAQDIHKLSPHFLSALEIITANVSGAFLIHPPQPSLVGSSSCASLEDFPAIADKLLQMLAPHILSPPMMRRAQHYVVDFFALADVADMQASVSVDSTSCLLRVHR
ncbi:hypothetical protein EDB85DRAFT_1890949 [Lactarius pseudohatsudake]|nr:hypothetical protein EDB85DRAFT_1890949 [Lactarius pseudohatsudake]